jgi:multidrug efflux system membrane fusion protein
MKIRFAFFGSLLAFLLLGGLLTGCQQGDQQIKTELTQVSVSKPVLDKDAQDWATYTGKVVSKENVQVRAKVAGYVTAVKFKEGAFVEAGKVLFEIDPSTYAANVKQAKGLLGLRKGDRDKADKNFARAKILKDEKGISQQEYDEYFSDKVKAHAAVLAAEGDLELAEANLKYCTITAPISGKVGKAMVTKGNLVQQANTTVMTNIIQMDPIYVEFFIDERALLLYKEAKSAYDKERLHVDLMRSVDKSYDRTGVADFGDIEVKGGTYLVRAKFDNKDHNLIPGAFAQVRVATSNKYSALLVSDRAVLTDQNDRYLLVAVKEGDKYRVKRKDVILGGLTDSGLRIIRSGITADDLVIVNGVVYARPEGFVEAKVEPMPTPPGAKSK